MKPGTVEIHFHWKFWKPKDCIGGPVYFGRWVRVWYREFGVLKTTDQSWMQYVIKGGMGLFRDQ